MEIIKNLTINNAVISVARGDLTESVSPGHRAGICIFGFQGKRSAGIPLGEVAAIFANGQAALKEMNYCLLDDKITQFFQRELGRQKEGN